MEMDLTSLRELLKVTRALRSVDEPYQEDEIFKNLFNRAARSPQGPGTKSTMDESQSESKTTTNGKETSGIEKRKSESRAKAHGQVANEHRPEKPEKDTKTVPRNRKLAPRRP